MKKILLAAILGAVIIFLWGFLSWTVIHFHDASYLSLSSGDEVADILKEKINENGVYYYPGDMGDAESGAELEVLEEKHKKGPLFTIIYIKKGQELMNPMIFIKGFVVFFIAALIITFILNMVKDSLPTFIRRFSFLLSFALFAGFATYINNYVWLHYPLEYSLVMALDVLIGWALAGILIAAIIKPERKYSFN